MRSTGQPTHTTDSKVRLGKDTKYKAVVRGVVLSASSEEQWATAAACRKHRMKAAVTNDPCFGRTSRPGWVLIPETKDYFVRSVSSDGPDKKTENRK